MKIRKLACFAMAALAIGMTTKVYATWPERTVKLVAPFAAGGNSDAMARLIAHHLSESLHQTVIVENRPGAGSMIGSQAVARSKPDGYTLLVGSIANVTNHYFYKKRTYDLVTDLVPVAQLVAMPNYIVANNNFPGGTLPELIDYAKSHPGKVNCASAGVGTSPYMSCVLLQNLADIDIVNVPYQSGLAAIQAAMGGEVQIVVANEVLPFIKDNSLTGLAVTTPERSPYSPDIPAASESIPEFDVTSWVAVFAPTGTPDPVIDRLNKEINQILQLPEVVKRFEALGAVPVRRTPQELGDYVDSELERWERIIEPLNISLD